MKKKILISMILIVFMIAMTSIVNAASFSVSLTPSTTNKLNAGDTVDITVAISNIDKGETEGTNALEGKIVYDSNVLEYVADSATAQGGWTLVTFNNGSFSIMKTGSTYVSEAGQILKLQFKVKETTSSSTAVQLNDVKAIFLKTDNSQEQITATNTSATLAINPKVVENITTPTNNTTSGMMNNVVNANQSNKTIPQTGVTDFILPAIIVLAIIAGISYVRYRKYNNM